MSVILSMTISLFFVREGCVIWIYLITTSLRHCVGPCLYVVIPVSSSPTQRVLAGIHCLFGCRFLGSLRIFVSVPLLIEGGGKSSVFFFFFFLLLAIPVILHEVISR